ncbi:MAG: hypothetical protein E7464_06985 [Ruminococcaceae bacterium]|nr:hypothetical protein [Oscillospiraceae bacterium]
MSIAAKMLLPSSIAAESVEKVAEITIVDKNTETIHFALEFPFFFAFFCVPDVRSDLSNSEFLPENSGSRQSKSYGLGRVGFPREEPSVAGKAVSF